MFSIVFATSLVGFLITEGLRWLLSTPTVTAQMASYPAPMSPSIMVIARLTAIMWSAAAVVGLLLFFGGRRLQVSANAQPFLWTMQTGQRLRYMPLLIALPFVSSHIRLVIRLRAWIFGIAVLLVLTTLLLLRYKRQEQDPPVHPSKLAKRYALYDGLMAFLFGVSSNIALSLLVGWARP